MFSLPDYKVRRKSLYGRQGIVYVTQYIASNSRPGLVTPCAAAHFCSPWRLFTHSQLGLEEEFVKSDSRHITGMNSSSLKAPPLSILS